jgi:hypothetical protein
VRQSMATHGRGSVGSWMISTVRMSFDGTYDMGRLHNRRDVFAGLIVRQGKHAKADEDDGGNKEESKHGGARLAPFLN